uniref:Uncharacterized protein n=1 Tax=Opuntia streptacantha TaxID=393608 RepID=A0A7C9CKR0_OPUST
MAFLQLITVFILALTFSRTELALCSAVKGLLLCTDCGPDYDFSGIRVLVKCDTVKKLSMAITDGNGAFKTDLPADTPTSAAAATSPNCLAKLLGGPTQLYAWKKNIISKIVLAQGDDESSYALDSPLSFSKSCPGKCDSVGSSKTIDLPVPPEYGLPPTSYYTPFIPIIGIP